MIFADSSVWINYFNGMETPEIEKLGVLLGVFPICIEHGLPSLHSGRNFDPFHQYLKRCMLWVIN